MSSGKVLDPVQIDRLITQILEQHFSGKEYDIQKSLEWSQQVADLVLEKLNTLESNSSGHRYKYIVNCLIQKHGSGLQSSSACLWNSTTDLATSVRFAHRDIDCTVNIYAVVFN